MMDPLRALAENARAIRRAKSARDTLLDQAATQGYSVNEMAAAMEQEPAAVRTYMRRHHIAIAKRRQQ